MAGTTRAAMPNANGALAAAPSLCTTSVQLPPQPPLRLTDAAAAPGRRGGQGAAANAAQELPRLVKIKDDLYVLQNAHNSVAEIGRYGGNVAIYLTSDGVILFDSKYAQMHDFILAQVRSLTDKPIKYVVLTHSHPDHAGGAAKMVEMGATVVISSEDRELLARTHPTALPQVAYHGQAQLYLGGKAVQLHEFCGHTRGDTVAYLPGDRVLVVGDLVTTPDSIPEIVAYGDGGNWTDLGHTLDAIAKMDFDLVICGHGPVLTKAQFLKHREKVVAIRERVRVLTRQGRSREQITQTLLKEFNYGTGPAAGQIAPMMQELK
jgi:glyoxylase-like metal-dependent hydrolase (beta-lactamase superfamily II)